MTFPEVGVSVFVRTITFHHVGEIVELNGRWLVLRNASWVADSGRFGAALRTGELAETERVDDVYINTDTIVDVFEWKHRLPEESI